MKYIILSLALAASACVVAPYPEPVVTKKNPAHTEVYYPGYGTVDYHCPPGQRKKGNC